MRYLKQLNPKIAYILVFLVILLLSYRELYLNTDYDVIGHNWDWSFPGIDFVFKRIYLLSVYTWFGFNLGSGLFLNISHIVPNSAISFLAYFIQIKYVVLVLLFLVNIVSFISFRKVSDLLFSKSVHNYIPAILYAFSPFLLNEIIGGSWYMWISFAFTPYFVYFLVLYIRQGKIQHLLGFLFSSLFVIASMQNFVMLEFITLFLLIIHGDLRVRKPFVLKFLRYVGAHTFLIIFNMYWILPFLYSALGLFAKVGESSFTGGFVSHYSSSQNIESILSLVGYFDRNMYYHMLPYALIPIFWICVFIFWAIVTVILFNQSRSSKSKLYAYLLLLMCFAFIAKGGNPPFGELTLQIYKSIPLFSLYRSIQHTMFSIAFLVPLIMSLVLSENTKEGIIKGGYLRAIMFCVVIVWCVGWWYRGDLGAAILNSKNRDHIDVYSIDPDFVDVLKYTQDDTDVFRILFLPTVQSPIYISNDFQNAAQGGIPEYMYLKNPTFSAEANSAANIVDTYFCKNTESNWFNIIATTNVKYIILRKDVVPIHTVCGKKYLWDLSKIEKILDADLRLKVLSEKKDFTLYEVGSAYRTPHIFSPTSFFTQAHEFSSIAQLDTVVPFGSYIDQETFVRLGLSEVTTAPYISFNKISPVEYSVTVRDAQSPFVLVLAENYESGWKVATPSTPSILKKLMGQSLVAEQHHIVVNGYANAWYIDPKQICQKDSCQTGYSEGSAFTLKIYYWPQYLLYLGSAISALVVFILSFLYLKSILKRVIFGNK